MEQTADAKRTGSWLAPALALLLFGVAIAAVQYKVPVIMGELAGLTGLSAAAASWLMSIFTCVGAVFAVPAGALSQRFEPKRMLLAASAVMIAGSLLGIAAGENGALLTVTRGIEGVALVSTAICGPLAVRTYVDATHVGAAMGIWTLWINIGSVLGGIATPTLYQAGGLAGVWGAYALLLAAASGVIVAALRHPVPTRPRIVRAAGGAGKRRADASEASGGREADASCKARSRLARFTNRGSRNAARGAGAVARALLTPNTVLFLFAFFAFNATQMAVLGYSPTFLQTHGFDATFSGFASTLPMLISMASAPLFGTLLDRTSLAKPLYIAALATMGPCSLIMLTQTGPILWVAAALMGLVGMGCPVVCLTLYSSVLGRPDLLAPGMGVLMLAQSLGQFLATWALPVLLGPSLTHWALAGAAVCATALAGVAALAACRFGGSARAANAR